MLSFFFLILAFLGAFFTSFVIGANSASPSFGPITSAGVIGVLRGTLIVGISAFFGAVIQGGSVANTMGNELIQGVVFDQSLASIILIIASLLILGGIIFNYPMPSAFTLVGSFLGAGIGAGGEINTPQLTKIFIFWLLIPFIAILISFIASKILRKKIQREESIDKIKIILLLLGIYTAYTAGANQSGLVIGPLINSVEIDIIYLLIFTGLGMLIGAWVNSPNIIQVVSREYSMLGPRRASAALLSASLLAQMGTFLGIPISFNEVIISSVIGSGMVVGTRGVSKMKIFYTILAWIASLLTSMIITFLIAKYILM